MPVGYGGGIRTVEDAKKLFAIGVEKVVLNTNAVLNFDLVKSIADKFGNQSVVFSLDVKRA
jgi:cyclase